MWIISFVFVFFVKNVCLESAKIVSFSLERKKTKIIKFCVILLFWEGFGENFEIWPPDIRGYPSLEPPPPTLVFARSGDLDSGFQTSVALTPPLFSRDP